MKNQIKRLKPNEMWPFKNAKKKKNAEIKTKANGNQKFCKCTLRCLVLISDWGLSAVLTFNAALCQNALDKAIKQKRLAITIKTKFFSAIHALPPFPEIYFSPRIVV